MRARLGARRCTDAATRLAYDMETGATALRSSQANGAAVEAVPAWLPEAARPATPLQLSRESVLVIWCQDAKAARHLLESRDLSPALRIGSRDTFGPSAQMSICGSIYKEGASRVIKGLH